MDIRCWNTDEYDTLDYTGKYILICYKTGDFRVGEHTRDADGERRNKGVWYNKDGTRRAVG